ncbi:MAG: hypothetical protein NZ890_11300 [Myxococcota bacterium]|nr:hypothetical protein [Myxococcota bacterium]
MRHRCMAGIFSIFSIFAMMMILIASCAPAQPEEACPAGGCVAPCIRHMDCGPGQVCETETGRCVPLPAACGPLNPSGACPEGQQCVDGTCQAQPMGCTDRLEPNDSLLAARPAPAGTTDGLRICEGDQDHFQLEVPKGRIATLGAVFDHKMGDLDLSAYQDGACLGGRLLHECSWNYRQFETGEEFLSVWNGSVALRSFAWKLVGYRGATNEYRLMTWLVPWTDGRDCAPEYGQNECEGRPEGPGGRTQLIQFPFPDPMDGYAGDSYRFDSAASYRWLRRELIMLVRYALRETALKFPRTKPLGLIDMSQRDGITPGYDVNRPRHPQTTHDQGGNIDIAYYTTLASEGSLPYNEARIICDAKEGSHDRYYCNASAAQTHVVDLPRQVYFMAKLYEHARLRVIGVDRVIGPLLDREAERQFQAGMISRAQRDAFRTKMAYGEGWPFHHHHIHVSMRWWTRPPAVLPEPEPAEGCGFDLVAHRRPQPR